MTTGLPAWRLAPGNGGDGGDCGDGRQLTLCAADTVEVGQEHDAWEAGLVHPALSPAICSVVDLGREDFGIVLTMPNAAVELDTGAGDVHPELEQVVGDTRSRRAPNASTNWPGTTSMSDDDALRRLVPVGHVRRSAGNCCRR